MADIADRVVALDLGFGALPRPPGVGLDEVWDVPVGVIRLQGAPDCGCEFSDCTTSGGRYEAVACPQCGNSAELHLHGPWSGPAMVLCPCGHSWRLGAENPAWAASEARLMQTAITAAVRAHGVPAKP